MCRAILYTGEPVLVEDLLYQPDNALVQQAHAPQDLGMLNLAGFGMCGWNPASPAPDRPWTYRSTTLPFFDENLRQMSAKLEVTNLLAHVRGVPLDVREGVFGSHNLHPFQYAGFRWAMAHNGDVRGFSSIRQELTRLTSPVVAPLVQGTTDSEFLYALVMSQLDDPRENGDADDLVEAMHRALRILGAVRRSYGLELSSSVNLFFSNGADVVACRFVYDFGRYPLSEDGSVPEPAIRYLSLWYSLGQGLAPSGQGWAAGSTRESATSAMIASEPLWLDRIAWTEVPEYSIVRIRPSAEGVSLREYAIDV